MSKSHGRLLSFMVTSPSTGAAQVDLSIYTQEVNGFPGEQDLGDVTVGGNVGHVSYPGLQKAAISTKHVFDDGTSASWTVLGAFQSLQQTYASTSWAVQFGPHGTTAGFAKLTCNALIKTINMPIKVTDPNMFTVNWEMTSSTGMTISSF